MHSVAEPAPRFSPDPPPPFRRTKPPKPFSAGATSFGFGVVVTAAVGYTVLVLLLNRARRPADRAAAAGLPEESSVLLYDDPGLLGASFKGPPPLAPAPLAPPASPLKPALERLAPA